MRQLAPDRDEVRRRLQDRPRRGEPRHGRRRSSRARRGRSSRACARTSPTSRRSSPPCPIPRRAITDFTESVRTRTPVRPQRAATATAPAPSSTSARSPSSSAGPCASTPRRSASSTTTRPTASSTSPCGRPGGSRRSDARRTENDDETSSDRGSHPRGVVRRAPGRPVGSRARGARGPARRRCPGSSSASRPENTAARDGLCAEILSLGPEAIGDVCARVLPPAEGDDSPARYAVNALAVCAARPGAEAERALFARVLLDTLAETRDETVAAFFLSQVQLVGKQESIPPLERYLVDERLAGPAAAALLTIGGPDADGGASERPGRGAPGRATGAHPVARRGPQPRGGAEDPPLRGQRRRRDSPGRPLRPGQHRRPGGRSGALEIPRRFSAPRETADALALPPLRPTPARSPAGRRRGWRRPGPFSRATVAPRSRSTPSEALALVVAALGERALPDLLAAADSPDRSFRGSALALAASIPGEDATLAWVEKARTSPSDVRADILAMLGERGDAAALPFVRESLRSGDEAVRLAAIPAAARLGGEAVLPDLLPLLGSAGAEESAVLKTALLGYPGALVVPEAVRLLDSTPLPARAVLIEVLGEKGARDQTERVFRLCEDPEPATPRRLRSRPWPGSPGTPTCPVSSRWPEAAGKGDDRTRLQEAIVAVVRRNPDPDQRADGLLDLLRDSAPAGKIVILEVLPKVGGTKPLRAVVEETGSPDPAVQSAAVTALARWPEEAAADELARLASTTRDPEHFRSAVEGYVRLVRPVEPAHRGEARRPGGPPRPARGGGRPEGRPRRDRRASASPSRCGCSPGTSTTRRCGMRRPRASSTSPPASRPGSPGSPATRRTRSSGGSRPLSPTPPTGSGPGRSSSSACGRAASSRSSTAALSTAGRASSPTLPPARR